MMKTTFLKTSKQRLILTFGLIAFVLALPLVAMQFTKEVNWNLFDFIVMGTLLSFAGLAIELVISKLKSSTFRITICLAILVLLLLTWAELAVGIFGTPVAGS